MKFNVFFQATGIVTIEADSQDEAEDKADELTKKQFVRAIDDFSVLDVVEEKKESDLESLPDPDR